MIELLQHDHLIFLFSPDDPEFLLKGYEDDRKDLIKQHNERDKLLAEIDDEFRALLGVDNAAHSKS